jgi:hypothetical protein
VNKEKKLRITEIARSDLICIDKIEDLIVITFNCDLCSEHVVEMDY